MICSATDYPPQALPEKKGKYPVNEGYVYILGNSAMPDLYKVGRTSRDVNLRAKELSDASGVPETFDVIDAKLFPDCHEAERLMHERFQSDRLNASREFFRADVNRLQQGLEEIHVEQLEAHLGRYAPSYSLIHVSIMPDSADVAILAQHLGISSAELVDLLAFIFPEDLNGALKRMRDHNLGVKKMDWLKPLSVAKNG